MKKEQPTFTFEGFEPANTTPVPDTLFDELLPYLTEAELKIMLYIIRRTWGFKKNEDAISLNQFQYGITTKDGKVLDKGCGIKDRKTITKALKSLENDKNCIEAVKGMTASGDHDITLYRIRFRVVGNSNHPMAIGSGKFQPPVVGKTNYGSGQNQPRVVGNSNPQETVLQSNSLQETEVQEGTEENTAHVSDDTSLTPTLSDELAEAVNFLNTRGYHIKFLTHTGSEPLFEIQIPNGNVIFETAPHILESAAEEGYLKNIPPFVDAEQPSQEESVPQNEDVPTAQSNEQTSNQTVSHIATDESGKETPTEQNNKRERITAAQINRVYDVIESMFRKVYNNPDYCIVRSEQATRHIKSLIKANATPMLVGKVFMALWDQEDKGEYWWRKPGRLTVKALVNQYSALAPSLMTAAQNNGSTPPKNETENNGVLGVSGLPRVQNEGKKLKVGYVPNTVEAQRRRGSRRII
jgi:hypothetical protein